LSKKGILLWFYKRNFITITCRFFVACAFIWLCFFGGLHTIIKMFMGYMNSISESQFKGMDKSNKKVKKKQDNQDVIKNVKDDKSSDFKVLSASEIKNLSVSERELYDRSLELHLLKAKLKEASNNEKDLFRPVMFFDGKVYLKNGLVITKNYKFKKGIYNEKEVSKIDYVNRGYYLSDGSFITM
jgi:hypothetical protein